MARTLHACADVHYRGDTAAAACLLFRDWSDEDGVEAVVERVARVERYEPGRFYLRELPCLLRVLKKTGAPLDVVVIDGYVWLGDEDKPGLGAHLYQALGEKVAVIGVAKSSFRGALAAQQVYRRRSRRPLYVTAAGMDPAEAARRVLSMHGQYRIPTLLKRVDGLCRSAWTPRGKGEGTRAVVKLYH